MVRCDSMHKLCFRKPNCSQIPTNLLMNIHTIPDLYVSVSKFFTRLDALISLNRIVSKTILSTG